MAIKLTNRRKKRESNTVVNLLLYAFLCFTMIPDIKANTLLYGVCSGLTVLTLLWCVFNERRRSEGRNNNYIFWICLFSAYSLSSLIWSSVPATNQISYFIINMIVLIPLSIYIRNMARLKAVLQLVVYSTITMCFFIFFFTDVSLIMAESSLRLASSDNSWNSNSIGISCSISFIICMYFMKTKSWSKAIYLLAMVLFLVVAVMTGSRKSILILLIGFSFYTMLKQARGKSLCVFGTMVTVAISIYLIISVPMLYDLVGVRFNSFFSYFTDKSSGDSSTQYRMDMILYGIEWFKNKPFIGYGMDNFRYLFESATGRLAYAHNNYIELLVGGGIIGFTLYYRIAVNSIRKLRKSMTNNRSMVALLLSILLTILCIDFALVSYNSRFIQIIMCTVFCGANICAIENESGEILKGKIEKNDLQRESVVVRYR